MNGESTQIVKSTSRNNGGCCFACSIRPIDPPAPAIRATNAKGRIDFEISLPNLALGDRGRLLCHSLPVAISFHQNDDDAPVTADIATVSLRLHMRTISHYRRI